jgi:thiol:disulfide interchange protein
MVNFGLNLASIIGILYILISLPYLIWSISQLIILIKTSNNVSKIAIKLLEFLLVPGCLLLSGLILLFNGWRLDPILQFQQILITIIIMLFLFSLNVR